jgi:membrane-bound serine protease (ClpP class)
MSFARWLAWWSGCLFAMVVLFARVAAPGPGASYVELRVTGVINPVKVRLVERALSRARSEQSRLLLVTLDTPGGLVTSMNEIVTALTNSSIPVITYVSPRSAQASSAGAFILLAGDIAAMAPGTRTGAAHPVADGGKALDGPLNDKVTNSLTSLIRSLAERKGRPGAEAEAMVRQSTSYTAEQAHEKKLIELLAADRGALLRALDGREVAGRALHTQGLTRIEITPSSFDSLLDHLADPTITSLLLSLGMLALLYELATPGVGAGGGIGALLLVLGFMGSSVLPIELGAVALLIIGTAALALEIKLPTHGVLGGAGVLAVVIGGLLLVDRADYFGGVPRVHAAYVVPVLAVAAGLILLLSRAARAAMAAPPLTGLESLVGRTGRACSSFGGAQREGVGTVFVDGARWSALSEGEEILADAAVTVVSVSEKPTRLLVRSVP